MPPRTTKPKQKSPLRIILRCSWSGARLTVPPDGLTLSSTLSEITSRVETSLPPLLSSASLVCLRKVCTRDEWDKTTLKEMLDGDNGSAGVLLTLDLGSAGGGGGKSVIDKAAASLNIKPEPMDVDDLPTQTSVQQPTAVQATNNSTPRQSSAAAWANVLQSNFDSTSKACLLTLLKIIDNILSKPNDTKVRSIRYANPAFQSKIVVCKGALSFMYSLGFEAKFALLGSTSDPESLELREKEDRDTLLKGREVLIISAKRDFNMEESELPKLPSTPTNTKPPAPVASTDTRTQNFDIYKGHSINIQAQQMGAPDPYANKSLSSTERQLQNLEQKKKNLEKKLQCDVEVDRGLIAYLPGEGPVGGAGGGSTVGVGGGEGKGDSSLVAARMKRMEEERKKREEGGFTTKAMRDLERMKKAKVYSHAQIRINFPDGTHLHAKFLPTETISTVRNVIYSAFHASCNSDFELYVAPPRRLLIDTKTLEQEELVPAAKIHVSWKNPPRCNTVGGFLQQDLFNANNNSSNGNNASFPQAKSIIPEKKVVTNNKTSKNTNDGQSKEDLMVARMMGRGLLGGKKKSTNSGGSSEKQGKSEHYIDED